MDLGGMLGILGRQGMLKNQVLLATGVAKLDICNVMVKYNYQANLPSIML